VDIERDLLPADLIEAVVGVNVFALKKLGWDLEDPNLAHIRDSVDITPPGFRVDSVLREKVASYLNRKDVLPYRMGMKKFQHKRLEPDEFGREKETIPTEDDFWFYIACHVPYVM
jgi:hypothetical protein